METRIKGKAIIGIALAAVIVVALMAMAPTASAATRTITDGKVVIIGETNVSWLGVINDGQIRGPLEKVGETGVNTTQKDFIQYFNTVGKGLVQAQYAVRNTTVGTGGQDNYTVYFNNPTLAVSTTDSAGGSAKGTFVKGTGTVYFKVVSNLEHIAGVDRTVTLHIEDPKGVCRDIADVALDSTSGDNIAQIIAAADLYEVGTWTVYAKTNKTVCNGLEKTSGSVTFNVIESDVTLTSDVDTQAESGEVVFSGTTSPITQVNLTVSEGTAANVNFIGGKGDLATTYNVSLVNVTSSKTGAISFVCNFTATGSYVIKAMVGTESAKVTVDIVSKDATVTTEKTTYSVGQKVTISGTSNIGTHALIAVGGTFREEALIKDDGTFKYKWPTTSKATGSYKIQVWIKPATIDTYPGDGGDVNSSSSSTSGKAADATTSILLTPAGLTVDIDQTTVAFDDEFVISGTAPGASTVEIILISPKGGSGKTLSAGTVATLGYERLTASVSSADDSFKKKITASANANAGTHYIAVYVLGGDGYYGNNGSTDCDTIAEALTSTGYTSLTGKTKDQIVAMMKDATINAVASDDIMSESSIKVESAFVALDTIADVAVGDTLNITGTCNREKYPILITVTGPSPVTTVAATASVTVSDGKYSTSVDTTGWATGTYAIKADDGDGHVAETTVGVVTEVAPAPTAAPTAKPTAAPAPTAKPTAAPTAEPTPEPPGFEAVFAIAGLLSIAYLVLRKRRE
jgi:PGF-CTERM protein